MPVISHLSDIYTVAYEPWTALKISNRLHASIFSFDRTSQQVEDSVRRAIRWLKKNKKIAPLNPGCRPELFNTEQAQCIAWHAIHYNTRKKIKAIRTQNAP